LLRVAAYAAYLGALVVFAGAALLGMTRGRRSASSVRWQGSVGTLLQVMAAAVVTRALPQGPLRPQAWELIGMLVIAPASALLFVWAQAAAARSEGGLVTDGAYAWVRHPMYLAFLGLLLATAFAVSARWLLFAGAVLFATGTELRIAAEEAGLEGYAAYAARTRWRYLPGLR
jgi:protein-S-isoprenylcysteine O-methyltransferase Ste14